MLPDYRCLFIEGQFNKFGLVRKPEAVDANLGQIECREPINSRKTTRGQCRGKNPFPLLQTEICSMLTLKYNLLCQYI